MREIVSYFAKLGWLAFGGPVGQIGLMHLQVVEQKKWIDEADFLRALNFCHILPGPEALQLAIYLGWKRRGYVAGVVAGLLFILPGYLTLLALAWVYVSHGNSPQVLGVLWGFRPVGLALLLAALIRISRAALKSRLSLALAVAAFVAFHFAHVPFIAVLFACGLAYLGWRRLAAGSAMTSSIALLAPALGLGAVPSLGGRLFDISWFFLKVGLFSFGGAYAVLPLIREGSVITYGWLTDHQMVDALALGETTPGPLISIGIFVGFLAGHGAGAGVLGATLAAFWLFLPSFVFVLAAAKHIDAITSEPRANEFLRGVTSGVVGLMLSVSIPLARAATTPGGNLDPWTMVLAAAAFLTLKAWTSRWNVVAVVVAGGLLGLLRIECARG